MPPDIFSSSDMSVETESLIDPLRLHIIDKNAELWVRQLQLLEDFPERNNAPLLRQKLKRPENDAILISHYEGGFLSRHVLAALIGHRRSDLFHITMTGVDVRMTGDRELSKIADELRNELRRLQEYRGWEAVSVDLHPEHPCLRRLYDMMGADIKHESESGVRTAVWNPSLVDASDW